MPKSRRSSDTKWQHPKLRRAYCYKRGGMVYACYDGTKRVSLDMYWLLENKVSALRKLTALIERSGYERRSLADAIVDFTGTRLATIKPSSRRAYRNAFSFFLSGLDCDVSDIVKARRHIETRLRECNEKKLIESNTVRKYLIRVRALYRFCMKRGLCSSNPVDMEIVPKWKVGEVISLTDKQVAALCAECSGVLLLFVRFMLASGCRISEVLAMRWSDITGNELLVHGKGGRDRILPMRELGLELPPRGESEFVWPWTTMQYPERRIKAAGVAAGVHLTSHILRKTCINRWAASGVDMRVRSYLAGNAEEIQIKHYLKEIKYDDAKRSLQNCVITVQRTAQENELQSMELQVK